MVQSPDVRLVTESALDDALMTELPVLIEKQKSRRLGDQFDGVRPGTSVPASKCVVSLSNEVDGYVSNDNKQHQVVEMYDVAECNWSNATLTDYGTAKLNNSKANNLATAFDFTTILEGDHMTITSYKLGNIAQDLRLWIDDVEVTDWFLGTRASGVQQTGRPIIPCTLDNAFYFLNLNFAKRGAYKIRCAGVVLAGGTATSFIATNKNGRFYKPAKQRTFGVFSDSWYDTIGSITSLNAGIELAARAGWRQWNMSVGGSGFVNPGPDGVDQSYGSDLNFAALAKAPELDLLLVNGSVNDMGYSEAQVIAAMQAFFAKWRTVRPNTPIVWQGLEPQSYFENIYSSATILAREEAQRAVAAADPSVIGIILPAKENWFTGTGSTAAPNGTGNQDYLIGGDGIHLSAFGTLMNGALVHERMKSFLTWKA